VNQAPAETSAAPEGMFVSGPVEGGWGICVAIATVWIAERLPTSGGSG